MSYRDWFKKHGEEIKARYAIYWHSTTWDKDNPRYTLVQYAKQLFRWRVLS